MSRLRSTALPALTFAVITGLLATGAPAQASTPLPATSVVSTTVAPAAAKPKPRVSPPKTVKVHEFEQGKVTINWSHVAGIVRYRVHAYKTDPKLGSFYPFNIVPGSEYNATTKRLSYTFVNNFSPWRDAARLQSLGWVITVQSVSPNKAHRDSSPKAPTWTVKDKIVYKTVAIKTKPTAKDVRGYKSVLKKCVAVGAGAAVTTAAGGALLAAAAIWIPGVNAVSWAAVAAYTVSAGIAGTLGCFVENKINPDSSLHLRVVSA